MNDPNLMQNNDQSSNNQQPIIENKPYNPIQNDTTNTDQIIDNSLPNKPKRNIKKIIVFSLLFIIALLVGLNYQAVKNYFIPAPIKALVKVKDKNETEKLYYFDKTIEYTNLESIVLTQNENEFIARDNINLRFDNNDEFESNKGLYYIKTENQLEAQFDSKSISINPNSEIIFNANEKLFLVISGVVSFEQEKVGSNFTIDLTQEKPKATKLNRNIFTDNQDYQLLLKLLSNLGKTPKLLKDLTQPEITNLTPSSDQTTQDEKITISGTAEKDANIKINDKKITINEEYKFTEEIKLEIGENKIEIIITDKSGNSKKYNFIITREESISANQSTAPTETSNYSDVSITSCDTAFASALLGYINTYRQSNGLNALSLESALSVASCNHSMWMNENNNLSHTGAGGSQFDQRCIDAGTTCDAENLAYGTTSAEQVFNLWKDSAGHNANMLAEHSVMGAGLSGTYSTAVFR